MIPDELDGAKVIKYTSNSLSNKFGTVRIINEKKETIDEYLLPQRLFADMKKVMSITFSRVT